MYERSELAELCPCDERTLQDREERGELKPAGIPGQGPCYYASDVEEFLRKCREIPKGRRKQK